jgi:hypothetical protein
MKPEAVTLEHVRARLATVPPTHPRLFADSATFLAAGDRAAAGGTAAEIATAVRRSADALLTVPPVTRTLQGRRLLGQSRLAVRRVLCLATAWRLTGQAEYRDRCRAELLAAAGFTDWNPSHFLDVAEMTFALAVGYDWLCNDLDAETRATLRRAIVEKGLRTSLDPQHATWWVRATNNWGQVCHGGLVAGALAVLEDEPELAVAIVQRAVVSVPASIAAYAPNGAYPEGPGYWSYGSTYNVLLLAEIESVLGTEFGLAALPGFPETGAYLSLVTGPSGRTFNYADGGDGRHYEVAVEWLAARFDQPGWLLAEQTLLPRALAEFAKPGDGQRFLPLALLWHRDPPAGTACALPLHWAGGGHVPVTLHRSSWTDPDALFVGVKAGAAKANHGHMDAGSFVFDAAGQRWAWDLGAQDYHSIEARGMNLWNSAQNSDRWTIFRLNNLSHNTLVIDGQLQRADATATMLRFSAAPAFPHTVVDLTPVYAGQANGVRRGVALLPSGELLVQDLITGVKPGASVRWGMVTKAAVATPAAAAAPGPLRLEQAGRTLDLQRLAPTDTAWRTFDTATPPNEWDSPNPGTRMIGFEATAPADGRLLLRVLLTPDTCKNSAAARVTLLRADPAEWGTDLPAN